MSKKIEFAEGLSLPIDAATQTFGILARKRGGKSFAAGKLVEGFYENDVQFVIISPVPNWYGLRLAADGKKPGLDVPILGGLRGDIPLSADAGKLIADTVVDTGRSFVLDVSQFSLGERKRFVTAFGEQLWQRQKGLHDPRPIHIVLEEAQLFIPQNPMPDERHMLGIWTEIVRLGGNVGIGITIISQRPQSVAKEALTQVECLVVLQVSGVPEKKALKEWIVEKGLDLNLLDELPSMKTGEAYIWSPQWLQHLGRHKVLPKWTFDSGATPKVGVKRIQAELKPIDLEALKAQMSETVKKVEENDPSALKKRVRELEHQLKKQQDSSGVAVSEVEAMKREFEHMHSNAISRFKQELQDELNRVQKFAQSWESKVSPRTFIAPGAEKRPNGVGYTVKNGTPQPLKVETSGFNQGAVLDVGEGDKVTRGMRSMLNSLAFFHPDTLTKPQIGRLADLSSSTGTFATYLGALRRMKLVYDEPNTRTLGITDAGLALVKGHCTVSVPESERIDLWVSHLDGASKRMLQELCKEYPRALTREELGERVGISPSTGTFATYLGMLRSSELMTKRGELKAEPKFLGL